MGKFCGAEDCGVFKVFGETDVFGRDFLDAKKLSGQFITTSAEVTPNGGLVRESPQNGLKLG